MMSDYTVMAPPGDGISSMVFSPSVDNHLLVSSWDSTLRTFDIIQNIPKSTHYFDGAVLSCSYNHDATQMYCGGLDSSVHMIDTIRNVKSKILSHDATVSSLVYNSDYFTLLSGSWDKTVNMYDSRQQKAASRILLPDKVYSISTSKHKVVISTANRYIAIYDIRNMTTAEQTRESPLKHQTRMAKCSPEGTSYTISSVEGRVAIEYFDMNPEVQSAKYAFKCHRNGDVCYPVNCLEYHPLHGTFASGGCDGIVNIWDGSNKKRLCSLGPYPTSIATMAFNYNGSLLAIASSYTYEEGEKPNIPDDNIFIHTVADNEVKPKVKPS